jgi:hypothetical protein
VGGASEELEQASPCVVVFLTASSEVEFMVPGFSLVILTFEKLSPLFGSFSLSTFLVGQLVAYFKLLLIIVAVFRQVFV